MGWCRCFRSIEIKLYASCLPVISTTIPAAWSWDPIIRFSVLFISEASLQFSLLMPYWINPSTHWNVVSFLNQSAANSFCLTIDCQSWPKLWWHHFREWEINDYRCESASRERHMVLDRKRDCNKVEKRKLRTAKGCLQFPLWSSWPHFSEYQCQ